MKGSIGIAYFSKDITLMEINLFHKGELGVRRLI